MIIRYGANLVDFMIVFGWGMLLLVILIITDPRHRK